MRTARRPYYRSESAVAGARESRTQLGGTTRTVNIGDIESALRDGKADSWDIPQLKAALQALHSAPLDTAYKDRVLQMTETTERLLGRKESDLAHSKTHRIAKWGLRVGITALVVGLLAFARDWFPEVFRSSTATSAVLPLSTPSAVVQRASSASTTLSPPPLNMTRTANVNEIDPTTEEFERLYYSNNAPDIGDGGCIRQTVPYQVAGHSTTSYGLGTFFNEKRQQSSWLRVDVSATNGLVLVLTQPYVYLNRTNRYDVKIIWKDAPVRAATRISHTDARLLRQALETAFEWESILRTNDLIVESRPLHNRTVLTNSSLFFSKRQDDRTWQVTLYLADARPERISLGNWDIPASLTLDSVGARRFYELLEDALRRYVIVLENDEKARLNKQEKDQADETQRLSNQTLVDKFLTYP